MQRVVIMGCPGSGKTTLAVKFAQMANLPVIHVDREFQLLGLAGRNKNKKWRRRHAALIAGEKWVIDGGHYKTAKERIHRADMIIWFELHTLICFFRVLKRIFLHFGRERADMAPGRVTRFNLTLLKSVLNFRRVISPKMQKIIDNRPVGTNLVIVRNNNDIDSVLSLLKT